MVEHIRKQGKFKNFLAVHDNYGNAAVALAVMISELSEEPWKGKLMNFSRNPQRHYFFFPENPQLHSLQGDLKAKLEILKDTRQWKVDLEVVFDSVLEVAVKNDLKPEQMIRRVFVFTSCEDFDKTLPAAKYEEIQRKFKDKGYGDEVPQIVFWKANNSMPAFAPYALHGMMMMNRFNDNLVKSFLDNDRKIGPDHVMEAAISDPRYQNIVVVD
ncbi:hypothetical protein GBA52_023862 [Prunus armeniaca]|nr:hypothetical protein GBA52_023862 [Prunus armeniaca]